MLNSEKEMNVLETQFRQRTFDGKWEKLVKVLDEDNIYTYTNENNSRVTLIPEKWICVSVYDYELTIEEWRK